MAVVHIRSLDELGSPVAKAKDGTELRFNCPYCIEVRGKADDDGKLYFNPAKGTGWCFKCHTAVFLISADGDFVSATWQRARELLARKLSYRLVYEALEENNGPAAQQYDISGFPPVREGSPQWTYLVEQRGVREDIVRLYNLRMTPLAVIRKGVLIPSEPTNKVQYWQIRFLKGLPKYLSPPKSKKPLFFLQQALGAEQLVLVEGVFDAMAMHSDKIPAVALLGTYLSDYQLHLLRSHFGYYGLRRIFICLDRDAVNKMPRLAERLKQAAVAREVELVIIKAGDPAEAGGWDGVEAIIPYRSHKCLTTYVKWKEGGATA